MKQVTQRLRDGRIEVQQVPMPQVRPEGVLVDVRASLLSAGTERTKVVTGRQSLIGKARSRPDQVRQVLDKARRDGVRETVDAVRMRLEQPAGLGYSAAGVAIAAGARVRGVAPGDRVACAGAGYAMHADVDYVPANLCVRLPGEVSFEEGAFATVGSIALHGVRQADVRIGERVAVIGLGLVGQLACQLLRAAGCTVVGIDIAEAPVEIAREQAAIDHGFVRRALDERLPRDAGECDAVVITAATKSTDPIYLAARLARDRGRVVVVGDVGMNVPRAAYYEKELEVRLSRSYGPGRYDVEYEERGLDYPIGYVRWTEHRNMTAFLDLLAARRIEVLGLVRERIPVDEAPAAYDRLAESTSSTLGVLLQYEPTPEQAPEPALRKVAGARAPVPTAAGVIGAGSFAQRILIPSLRGAGFSLQAIASAAGLSAAAAKDRFGFERSATVDDVIEDPAVGVLVIATRHDTHAELAERGLRASKAVFVEKPPCLTTEELERLHQARTSSGCPLVVGFNRRYAPLAMRLRAHVAGRDGPMEVLLRVNAGPLGRGHWLNDLDAGGGRLLGEGCHFIDFACWLVGSLPTSVFCSAVAPAGGPLAAAEQFSSTLSFSDGSIATILYGAGGATRLGKEYAEVHCDGRSAVLDDYRSLTLYDGRDRTRVRSRGQDKGHADQALRLFRLLGAPDEAREEPDPLATMSVTFAALQSAETACAVAPSAPGMGA